MKGSVIFLAGLLAPASLAAQLPDPATRALAMGGAYTGLARGYEAVAWNPAMLAARGRPGFSLGLPHILVETGSNTYGFSDFRTYANRTLSETDKQDLLDKIGQDDSVLTIRTLAGFTPVAISIGPFAFSAGSSGDMDFSLGRDAIELALYGNAARTGAGEFFTARGSAANGWAATTLAGSFAQAFNTGMGRLALGVTYKRVIGNFIGRAAETTSSFQVNPQFQVQAAGHAIFTDYSRSYDPGGPGDLLSGEGKVGSGFGVDIGAVLQSSNRRMALSAVVVNAFGSMEWDAARFRYERAVYSVVQNADGSVTDNQTTTSLTTAAAIEADATARALRDAVLGNSDFSRYVRAGATWRWGGLSLAAGGLLRLTEGLDRVPSKQVGAGAEYRLLGFLPLRAGVATDISNTLTLSAGSGLQLLGINLDASIASISGSERPGVIVGLGLGMIW